MKRIEDYSKKQAINELYIAVQSEGSRLGRPNIVIRTTGCTHRCYFGEKGGWCDTWYSSIAPEKGKYSMQDIEDFIKDNPQATDIMLTGGSPTMQPVLCNEIMHLANKYNLFVTIETEGSHFVETDIPIDLVSLSPKFSNSVPVLGVKFPEEWEMRRPEVDERFIRQHEKFRLNKDAIAKSISYHKDYHYKPVVNPIQDPDTWKEVEEFRVEMGIPKSKTFIMPPGDTPELLFLNYGDVMRFCAENGYCFTPRSHIMAFGTMRGV